MGKSVIVLSTGLEVGRRMGLGPDLFAFYSPSILRFSLCVYHSLHYGSIQEANRLQYTLSSDPRYVEFYQDDPATPHTA